jgi:hypothetical protein
MNRFLADKQNDSTARESPALKGYELPTRDYCPTTRPVRPLE